MILNLTAFFVRTEKSVTRFLFPVTVFRFPAVSRVESENSSKIFASSPFFARSSLSRAVRECTFHNIPQMESLLAG